MRKENYFLRFSWSQKKRKRILAQLCGKIYLFQTMFSSWLRNLAKWNQVCITHKIFEYILIKRFNWILVDHFKEWLGKVFFPNTGKDSVLLLDSWSGHCPSVVEASKPKNKNIKVLKIPEGTTGKIQPLDVFGFRMWKNFVRHFSDSVLLLNEDLNLHLRNNIIKLQSLTHNQFSSPRYVNLFKYAWFQSGYINKKPEEFENPVEISLRQSGTHCEIPGCSNIAIIRCSWCQKSLCLKHFFEDYHFCSTYKP